MQPTSHVEREQAIDLDYTLGGRSASETEEVIDDDPSFSDHTELANRITLAAGSDALPTINGVDAGGRFKRETSRARRACIQNTEHCKMLLQTVQNYLAALNSHSAGGNVNFVNKDILNCLHCKNMQLANTDAPDKEFAPQLKDRYFPHDYTEQKPSQDSGITFIKLLNDRETKGDAQQTKVNRTEAPGILTKVENSVQNVVSQNAAYQSSKKGEITTVSIDHIGPNVTDNNKNSTANVKNGQPWDKSIVNDSHIKVQSNESIPIASYVVEKHDAAAANKGAPNSTILLQIPTTEPSVTSMQYSDIIVKDAISTVTAIVTNTTETNAQNSIDLANHTTITENVTSVPVGYDTTGIGNDGTLHPSFEGHPENRSATSTNGT